MSRKKKIVVHRKGYTAHRNGKKYHVKPTTYEEKDRGKKGHGEKLFDIKKGKLAPYSVSMPERQRHEILEKKIRKYGALSVFRSLNAQVVLRKHERGKAAKAKKKFEEDKEWVKKHYLKGR